MFARPGSAKITANRNVEAPYLDEADSQDAYRCHLRLGRDGLRECDMTIVVLRVLIFLVLLRGRGLFVLAVLLGVAYLMSGVPGHPARSLMRS